MEIFESFSEPQSWKQYEDMYHVGMRRMQSMMLNLLFKLRTQWIKTEISSNNCGKLAWINSVWKASVHPPWLILWMLSPRQWQWREMYALHRQNLSSLQRYNIKSRTSNSTYNSNTRSNSNILPAIYLCLCTIDQSVRNPKYNRIWEINRFLLCLTKRILL